MTDERAEAYIASVLAKLPLPYDIEADPPPMTALNPQRDALRTLISRGLAEVDYDTFGNGKVVPKAREPEPEDLKPFETPALLALRERRRTLGR